MDTKARRQALDIHTSFVVQAPAGSGKTELLISRLLALFADAATLVPEQVLAITFTRKAAAEIVTRLLGALRAADKAAHFDDWLLMVSYGDVDKAESLKHNADALMLKQQQYFWACCVLQKKEWALLTSPHRLGITTIDGFCNALARQTPLLGQLAPGLNVADDVSFLYDMAARQTLNLLESHDTPDVSDAIAVLLSAFDNDLDQLRVLLANQLANRDQWLIDLDDLDTNQMQSVLERLFQPQVIDYLLSIEHDLPELARIAGVCLQALLASDCQDIALLHALTLLNDDGCNALDVSLTQQLSMLKGISFLCLTKDGKGWRKTLNKSMGLAAATHQSDIVCLKLMIERYAQDPAQLAQLQSLIRLPSPTYSEDDHQRIAALKTLLSAASRQLLLVFAEYRQTDHTQFTQAALIALDPMRNGNVSDILLKLDAQLRHILIDEFQDTSVSQWALLRHLMAGWESNGLGQEKQGRTLFLVGDPMQSIYRFRKAEPALFTTAKTQGIPLEHGQHFKLIYLQLSRNFRSLPAIIDFTNRTFDAVFPSEIQAQLDASLGACVYASAHAVKDDRGEEADVQLWLNLDEQKVQCDAPWYDIHLTDASIRRIQPYPHSIDSAQRIRVWLQHNAPKKPSSVAILVRSKRHLLPILAELNAHHIPVHAEEVTTLTERWYIQDCLALTRFLVDPSDRVACLSVLRAPWCGLSLTALHRIAQDPDPLWDGLADVVAALPLDDQPRLILCLQALRPLIRQRGQQPIATQVRSACLALGLFPLLPDDRAVDDVRVYWRLLRSLQQVSPHFDLATLNQSLAKLFATPRYPNAPVVAMTIHKSKGLEFDTVILPSLDQRGARDRSELLVWQKLAQGDGVHDVIAPLGKERSPLFVWLQSLETKKSDYELERLLYVAVTRAVKQLILIATVSPIKEKEGFGLPSATNTFMQCLWKSPMIQKASQSIIFACLPPKKNEAYQDDASFRQHNRAPSLLRFDVEQLLDAQHQPNRAPAYLKAIEPLAFLATESSSVATYEDQAGSSSAIGSVTHLLLERIAQDGIQAWSLIRLEQQKRWIAYQLRCLSVLSYHQDNAISTIMLAIKNTIEDVRGQWILRHWQQAHNEWVLMDVDVQTGKLQRHILDRSFVDEQGVRWIIDYKTSQANNTDIHTFIASQLTHYRAQLERYRYLVQQLDPKCEVKTALFFPLLPQAYRWQLVKTST